MSHSDSLESGPARRPQRSLTTVLAFVLGLPLGAGLIWLAGEMPWVDLDVQTLLKRYVSHPVEVVTVLLFGCAMSALGCKFLGGFRQWLAMRQEGIPTWDGQPAAVTEARNLLQGLGEMSRGWLNTLVGRRIAGVLEFVDSRRSANDLDDHLRGLADNDDIALDGSYALIRFITWAMPILGFLGTVLGITDAIAGVNPEVLEKNLNAVTDGLATAFDTTAVALALTMVVMFFTFVTERLEQSQLESVNRYVDEQLAHRFERTGPESGEFVNALRQNVDILLKATEQIVQRQAEVWNSTVLEARKRWHETGAEQQQAVTGALKHALSQTLAEHSQMLQEQELRSVQVTNVLLDRVRDLTAASAAQSQQEQKALTEMVASVTAQTQVLTELTEGGNQLLRLQDVLQQNLQAIALAGQFEQAVNSLTAAIHLLTARSGTAPAAAPTSPRLSRPGAAA